MYPDAAPALCRTAFPMLSERVYLDTGSAGLTTPAHARAAARFYEDKAQGYLGRDAWLARAAAVRERLAAWLEVPQAEIEFYSGTTDALNLVAHCLQWQPGDEVVVAADEFPSVRLAWGAAERAGATLVQVPVANEAQRADALLNALSPRTRVLVVSHVHSFTGTRLDLDRLGAACRERDCLLVVDGIQALGATPVSLRHVDVYMSGAIKWLLAGFGIAVGVVRERARQRMRPAFRGSMNPPPDAGLQFAHFNYPAAYVLEASLLLLGDELGWDTVYGRTAQLVQWLATALEAGGLPLAAPPGARAGIASFVVPDPEATRQFLAERRIHVAARGRYLRASPFFYNSRADVQELAAQVLRHLQQHGG